MTFRGKLWKRVGNHYNLVGTGVNVYYWNSGKNSNYMVEIIGIPVNQQNTFTIPGKGETARDKAIETAFNFAKKYFGWNS